MCVHTLLNEAETESIVVDFFPGNVGDLDGLYLDECFFGGVSYSSYSIHLFVLVCSLVYHRLSFATSISRIYGLHDGRIGDCRHVDVHCWTLVLQNRRRTNPWFFLCI